MWVETLENRAAFNMVKSIELFKLVTLSQSKKKKNLNDATGLRLLLRLTATVAPKSLLIFVPP